MLTSLTEGESGQESFIATYNGFQAASGGSAYGDDWRGNVAGGTKDKRTFVAKDEKGEVIFENGEPKTVEFKVDDFFDSNDFYESFYDTLNRTQLQAIQDKAIAFGYIDAEDLGMEVNGVRGPITEALILEVLDYAVNEMEEYYPQSMQRNNFVDRINEAKVDVNKGQGLNALLGGLTMDEGFSDAFISDRQVFIVALQNFLEIKKSEEAKLDRETAEGIRAANVRPTNLDLEKDLDNYWRGLYGTNMSDARKQEFIDDIGIGWSDYVTALVAQDKYIRANEVYKTHKEVATVDPITEEPSTKFVQLDVPELQDAFNVQNPIDVAKDEIDAEAEKDSEFRQNAATSRDVQEQYMKYITGRG
tara:strand:- start:656 stop:1738 length:1083 start_codon:yes stop_codon:yes gene_type:complete